MDEIQLKMNDAKTEFIVIGTLYSLRKKHLRYYGNWKIKYSPNIQI